MKSNYYKLLGILAVVLLLGCSDKVPVVDKLETKPQSAVEKVSPSQKVATATSKSENNYNVANNCSIKLSPLEYAQKEYLDAYNDYVRLLRESGPQTIETLQALAIYQKKYQIYEMLTKAAKKEDKK
jgi:hypothetical protein